MTVLISGGAKNGKSTLAQDTAVALSRGGKRYYLATMIPADEEDQERIRRHVRDRAGLGFLTVERGTGIRDCLKEIDREGTCLLDSVTALLSNELFPADKGYALDDTAPQRIAGELTELAKGVRNIVFVSDYLYSDARHYDPVTQAYREALAYLDRTLAQLCDTVVEVCAGQNIVYKGELPL